MKYKWSERELCKNCSEVGWSMEREEEWNDRVEEKVFVCESGSRKNWKCAKYEKYEIGKY